MRLKHLQKHLKNTWNHCKHTQHLDKTITSYVWKHMQHSNKHTCNIHTSEKKQMKHWEQELATYVYNHCNITIYFCNIRMKYLQHTSETFKTLSAETSPCCLKNGGSSACGVRWRQRPGSGCKQRLSGGYTTGQGGSGRVSAQAGSGAPGKAGSRATIKLIGYWTVI
jgi:hypothetical protein